MALPNFDVNVVDGALGLSAEVAAGLFAQVGPCSAGVPNVPVMLTDPGAVEAAFGAGPLATALRDALMAGARRVVGVRSAADGEGFIGPVRVGPAVAGIGPVTHTGDGTGQMTVSGWLDGHGVFEVEIVQGGEVGVATFKVRAGDAPWSEPATTGASVGILDSNLVLHFADGSDPSFVAEDTYSFEASDESTGEMAVTGNPTVSAPIRFEVLSSGRRNEATMRMAWGAGFMDFTLPADGEFDTTGHAGVIYTWPDAFYTAGTVFEVDLSVAESSVAAYAAAVLALRALATPVEWVHVVGPTAPATWVALAALAESEFAATFRYLHILAEARGPAEDETVDEWVAALVADAGEIAHARLSVVAGRAVVADPYTGAEAERSAAAVYAARLSLLRVHESPGKVVSGPLSLLARLPAGLNDAHIEQLDAARYVTVRLHEGIGGVYVTNGRMMASTTSDYRWVEWRRTMDKACRLVRVAGVRSVHREGDEIGLLALASDLEQPLAAMTAAGEIAGGAVSIPPDQDIAASSALRVSVRVRPVPTLRHIEAEVGFENPFRV
jgi:hypothetical protein